MQYNNVTFTNAITSTKAIESHNYIHTLALFIQLKAHNYDNGLIVSFMHSWSYTLRSDRGNSGNHAGTCISIHSYSGVANKKTAIQQQ